MRHGFTAASINMHPVSLGEVVEHPANKQTGNGFTASIDKHRKRKAPSHLHFHPHETRMGDQTKKAQQCKPTKDANQRRNYSSTSTSVQSSGLCCCIQQYSSIPTPDSLLSRISSDGEHQRQPTEGHHLSLVEDPSLVPPEYDEIRQDVKKKSR